MARSRRHGPTLSSVQNAARSNRRQARRHTVDRRRLRRLLAAPHARRRPCLLLDAPRRLPSLQAGPATFTPCRAKGTAPTRPISFHETNSGSQCRHNGRVIYTRWDYVDRDAVYYQQLWSTRQDGTDVRIFYGNNTFNPPGMWEPKAIPGSDKIVAVAGAHHAMSAGSVVMLDVAKGVDGTEPVKRLTPDVRFPEGEAPVPGIPQLPTLCDFDYVPGWFGMRGAKQDRVPETPEERRCRVHSFKSPFPLAEKYFVASYSFDQLLGKRQLAQPIWDLLLRRVREPRISLSRPNISVSGRRPPGPTGPPVVASALDKLRQDLSRQPERSTCKTCTKAGHPNSRQNQGAPDRSGPPEDYPERQPADGWSRKRLPGKQVLGTVPVEEDGSFL